MSEEYNPNSVDSKFTQILTRLENQDQTSSAHHTEIIQKLADVDKRVTALEQGKAKLLGAVAASGLTGGGLGHILTKLLGGGSGTH